jgi:solute carrier family 12 (potassium/chloride transporters), member 9
MGAFSSAFFSALLGIVGCAKLLQAIARYALRVSSHIRDNLLSFLTPFAKGTDGEEPITAVLVTYLLTQIILFSNINQIASFVTMTFLLTFMVVNLACFLLRISSAPNFRPSFHYFTSYTAFTGVIVSFVTMYVVDGVYATVAASFMFVLFLLIHYFAPPKAWGDVTQSLIYHQVRKFLLRLDTRKGVPQAIGLM